MTRKEVDEVDQNENILINEINFQDNKSEMIDLNDYILQNQIGIGSFGKVYKLKNKKTGEIVAGKISIQKLDSNSETMKNDLLREVNIISKLNHPSILKFIGYSPINFKNKPKPVIITEFAENGSLSDLIKMKLDDTQKLIILYGIVSAMVYLHEHDIIHRDLKLENILIDRFLYPKIADFGLSKIKNKNEWSMLMKSTESAKGTPIYMAPEIWEKYEYSKASDVYAFSIIAYEIITNLRPFENINKIQLLIKIKEGFRPDMIDSIPISYRNLIQQCWSQNPSNRPTFDQILYQLKNDDGFITDKVDKNEYFNYIKYVDEQNISFDSFKRINIMIQSKIFNISVFDNIENYPLRQFLNLNEECKILVENAENNEEKQFQLGQILVEGQELFYQNAEIGIKYLKKCMKKGLIKSANYLCEMYIKGNIVPQNLVKARKILEKYVKHDEQYYYLLLGKIYKKEYKYEEAKKFFEKSLNLGNNEAMYEFGRILFKGKSGQIDKDEGIEYFKKAIENGCLHAMFKYGLILKKGVELEKNLLEAYSLIQKAADNGCSKAIFEYFLILKSIENDDSKKELNNYLQKAAYKGIPEAMHEYARCLLNQLSFNKDSMLFLKKASDKGHIESMCDYGSLINFASRKKMIEKPIDIVKYIRIAANSGHPIAMVKYADMILEYNQDNLSIEDGIDYIKKAIEKGNNVAMNLYASYLIQGIYVPQNIEEGLKYIKIGIEKGDDESMLMYANMLNKGQGIPVNKEEAAKYYYMSGLKGNDYAIVNFAYCLYNGEGINANKEKAIEIFKSEIDAGNVNALFKYAFILENDCKVINKNEAIKYYQMAIEKGNVDAMNNLAMMYLDGNGTKIDKSLAIKYFKMAINKGSIIAMINYSDMLLNGDGVEMDIDESIRLLKIAIDRGSKRAMYKFAVILINGKKIEQNYELAIQYLKMAISKSEKNSMFIYAKLLFNGIGIQENKVEAAKYFKMAADRGVIDAMEFYANMNLYGDGIPQNEEEAKKYFKMHVKAQMKMNVFDFSF